MRNGKTVKKADPRKQDGKQKPRASGRLARGWVPSVQGTKGGDDEDEGRWGTEVDRRREARSSRGRHFWMPVGIVKPEEVAARELRRRNADSD